MPSKYTYPFDPRATNNTAATVYALARRGGHRVLDVGSGPAIVSSALAGADGREVVALDVDVDALAAARDAGVSRTHVVDLAADDWWEPVGDGAFDVVVLADVLEHLVDPAALLRALTGHQLLAPDGVLVVSIPNANHLAVLAELLAGRFTYSETGLLDSTHLRWFTLETITQLLGSCGLEVVEVHRTLRLLEQTAYGPRADELPEPARTLLAAGGGASLEHRTYQYVLLVRPAGAATRAATLADELDATRAELWRIRRTAEADRERSTADLAASGEAAAAALRRADAAEQETARIAAQLRATTDAAAADAARVAALGATADRDRGSVAAARADAAAAAQTVESARATVEAARAEAEAARGDADGARSAAAATSATLAEVRARLDARTRDLARVRGSRTFRVAGVVRRAASPAVAVRRAVRGRRGE